MKKLITSLVFISTALIGMTQVYAQSDNAITWTASGFIDEQLDGTTLELDIKLSSRFAAANGIVVFTNGSAVATTGTCFVVVDNRVVCDLSMMHVSLALDISLETLNGAITILDELGEEWDSAGLQLIQIE